MSIISIIIPVYNAEKYISKCIQSLINQTFKDIEIVCINDGSTDNSLSILEEFAKKDIRIKIISQINSGPAAARNNGLINSTGSYIMFCDSDDWYEHNMCEVMYNAIIQKNVDCVMCGCNIVKENFKKYRIIDDTYYNSSKNKIITEKIHSQNVLLWNKIFKKSIIDKYNIKFPSGYKHDDDCFWSKYSLMCNSMYILKNKLYNYIIRENSIMDKYFSGKQESYKDRIYILKDLLLFAEHNKIIKNKRNELIDIFISQINEVGIYINLYNVLDEIVSLSKIIGYKIYITEKQVNKLKDNLFYLWLRYYFYKILSKIFFGSVCERHKKHYIKIKQKYEEIKCFKQKVKEFNVVK